MNLHFCCRSKSWIHMLLWRNSKWEHRFSSLECLILLLLECNAYLDNINNMCVIWQCRYASNIENKRIELFEGPSEGYTEENVLLASGKCFGFFISLIWSFMIFMHQCITTCFQQSKKVYDHFISIGVTLLIEHTLCLINEYICQLVIF
jgi:hypothetical protein